MVALPLANWITEHILEIHGIGFNGDQLTWVPFFGGIFLLLVFKLLLEMKWTTAAIIATPMTAIMAVVEMSHGTHVGTDSFLGFVGISWHVVYIWITAGIVCALAMTAAQDEGEVPGTLRALMEMLIEFVRNFIVRPVMGEEGDEYLPWLMSFFTLILFSNLLGLTPASTTATGSIYVTAGLALLSVAFYHGMGIRKYGALQHLINIVPVHADLKRLAWFVGLTALCIVGFIGYNASLPAEAAAIDGMPAVDAAQPLPAWGLFAVIGGLLVAISGLDVAVGGGIVLWLFMLGVELIGHFAKPFALAVRLFANMTGGHAVLYVMFGFTFIFKSYLIGLIVAVPASFAITMLEIMVAVIQAYVFTILTTVFLQGSIHPEH